MLQEFVKARARAGCEDWRQSLSPRVSLDGHPASSPDVMEMCSSMKSPSDASNIEVTSPKAARFTSGNVSQGS